jgi:hypothetical protein
MGSITCCIRYNVAPGKWVEFAHYARVWKLIIERLGGTHQGCFVPGTEPPDATRFSFPDIARKGPSDVATVIFSFKDLASYERYRQEALNDPECRAITDFYNQTKCFTSYERSFVERLEM